jgi:hypothetical protein
VAVELSNPAECGCNQFSKIFRRMITVIASAFTLGETPLRSTGVFRFFTQMLASCLFTFPVASTPNTYLDVLSFQGNRRKSGTNLFVTVIEGLKELHCRVSHADFQAYSSGLHLHLSAGSANGSSPSFHIRFISSWLYLPTSPSWLSISFL